MVDMLTEQMFSGDVRVKNVKLFPGTNRDATPAEIKNQVLRVVSEIENDVLEVIEWGDDD